MPRKTTKVAAAASAPFQAADHLRSDAEIAAYIESMLEDGDARTVPVALRTAADAAGGMEKAEGIVARYRKTPKSGSDGTRRGHRERSYASARHA